ncbi:MAG: response regulator [Oscillospiraceae bacterium]|nr:response regulator [Oscillospiraceae bacterium]
MVYNIYGFVRFARFIRRVQSWRHRDTILYVPIALLVLFLLGYLAVGLFGDPDLIMAGILFGGSIFVFIMYRLLYSITQRILESEKAKTEAELRAAKETGRAKSAFLASISHEMRTPMNMILGMDSIALKNPGLEPETREQLEKIGMSARHLLDLINNILDLNSMENGRMRINHEEFSLSTVLDQVDIIVRTLCGEKGLEYRLTVPPELRGRYVGDETQLRQMLLRLLDNAVKYTDAPGEVTLSVESAASEGNLRRLRFTVRDTGVGMDKSFLPHLFEAFAQEDASYSTRYGGSGLSLAATKGILDLMGGEISVKSEKNAGSVFTVTIPLEYVGEEELPETPEAPEISLDGKRVLIAEDIPMNAEIVMTFLEMEGVECAHAENGQIALDMFAASPPHHFDAILMDLRMPEMDGLDATRKIRALDRPDAKTVPIIALTANASEGDVAQSMAAGMNMHMAKPADAGALYATLRRFIAGAVLEGREAEKEAGKAK